jgi:hypothetical protein
LIFLEIGAKKNNFNTSKLNISEKRLEAFYLKRTPSHSSNDIMASTLRLHPHSQLFAVIIKKKHS